MENWSEVIRSYFNDVSFQYDFEGFDVLAGLRKAIILLCAFATSASINKL